MSYSDDELLMISGIQHYHYCKRQWYLIHAEQQWSENLYTTKGNILHEKVDEQWHDESRKNIRIVRSMPLISKRLGLRGVADVVEFQQIDTNVEGETCLLEKRRGWWRPVPIEYKRGRPKPDERDAVQLCAQAMALEEMLGVVIPRGYLFYGQTKRRQEVFVNDYLRTKTIELAERMHRLFDEGKTPPAVKGKHCNQCSLQEECQPQLMTKHRSVNAYIRKMCNDEGVD